jgi:peptidoglycan/xylan/chitin deacetylase (PgdA/CDA1 family)
VKTLKHAEAMLTVRELCSQLDVQPVANSIMSWDTLRKLQQEGLILGAHTRTHPLLNRVSLEEVRQEVVLSFEDLKREIGFALPIFAYPSGEFNQDVVSLLKREGFSLAFTTKRGVNHLATMDPLRIQRINVGDRTSLSVLRAQLLSWTVHFNRLPARLDPKI